MHRLIGIFFIIISMLCEAFYNIAFKHAANTAEKSSGIFSNFVSTLKQFRFIAAGIICFIFEAASWSVALHFLDVSQAFPIGSIELIMVLFLSRIMLKELIGIQRWAGVALIVAGTILVGLS